MIDPAICWTPTSNGHTNANLPKAYGLRCKILQIVKVKPKDWGQKTEDTTMITLNSKVVHFYDSNRSLI